jgi:hypothetical protein
MAIETVDDIVEEVLDLLGIYGAHSDSCKGRTTCRCCASSNLTGRLRAAFDIERRLGRGERRNEPN